MKNIIDRSDIEPLAYASLLGLTRTQTALLLVILDCETATRENLAVLLSKLDLKTGNINQAVKIHIHYLRAKLKPLGIIIKTVWGIGYFISPEDKKALINIMKEKRRGAKIARPEHKTVVSG